MKKRKLITLIINVVFMLTLLAFIPVTAQDSITELLNVDFSDEAAHGSLFAASSAISIEWVTQAGIGHGDDSVLKVTNITESNYNSFANAVRLVLDEPLPVGGIYHISAWFYVPAEENEGKETLTGPGFVINDDYAGAQGVTKFPEDFGTMPVGQWKEINVTLPVQYDEIEALDFRFVINEKPKHPDVWYIDNIVISRIGEVGEIQVPQWDLTLPSLREVFAEHFPVGNILEPREMNDTEMLEMFKHHYNFVTLENAMKPGSLSSREGAYNYTGADRVVDWALANDMLVHGHALVWHQQSAAWLTNDSEGNPLTRDEAKANLEAYINEVAGHFKGRIHSWEVVNEALTSGVRSGGWRANLRTGGGTSDDSPWYAAYENGADLENGESGADYIYDAFVFARLADPGAILYYNDFNEHQPNKTEAMAQMAEELNELWKADPRNTEPERLLIEGIGMQAHYWTDDLNPADVENAIKRFIQTGCEIGILELDMPVGSYRTLSTRSNELSDAEARLQANLYRGLFEIFTDYSEHISRVSIWGKADPQSWRAKGSPLMFDEMFSAKQPFYSILEVMGIVSEEPAIENPPPVETPAPPIEEEPAPLPDALDVSNEKTAKSATNTISAGLIILLILAVAVGVADAVIKDEKK